MQSKPGYKQTQIGEIPEEWELFRLGENGICDIKYGKANPRSEGNIPVIGSAGIYAYVGEQLVDSPVLIIGRKGNAGAVYLCKQPCWPSDTTFYVKIVSPKLKPDFLFSILVMRRISGERAKTTLPSLTKDYLGNQLIPVPPIAEQQKIISILSTIDEAIQKTNEVVGKAEMLKRGLMQRLLTRGIGHTRFKQAELGEIPETWKIMMSIDVCFRVTDGTHDTPKPSETGYPLITSKNLKEDSVDFSDSYLISEYDFIEVNKRSKVDPADVLFGMIGTIGNPTLVLKEHPSFAIKNVGLFKTAGDMKLGQWLSYYLSSQMIQRYLSKRLKGTSQKFVPLGLLRKLPIPMPPEDERTNIISILSTVDTKIRKEKQIENRLRELKKGLMQVLLTGKVRVA